MYRTGNQKPLLIVLAAFTGILILTVAAAFLIYGRTVRRFRSSAGTPYPYAWTEGSLITLTLDSAGVSNGVWTTDSEGGGTVVITIGEAENGKTEVTLRPITEGRAEVAFTLTDGETRLAEARFTVEAEQDERRLESGCHGTRGRSRVTRNQRRRGYRVSVQRQDERFQHCRDSHYGSGDRSGNV